MKPGLIIVMPLFFFSLSGQIAAQSLESCAAIDDPTERLTCYDTLAGRLPAYKAKTDDTAPGKIHSTSSEADVIKTVAPSVTPTASSVEPTPDAEAIFGLERKRKAEVERPDELRLKWAQKKKDAYGKWIITLENGQVWHQTDSRCFSFSNSEQWVIISRGILGPFFLGEPDRNGSIRVKRIK